MRKCNINDFVWYNDTVKTHDLKNERISLLKSSGFSIIKQCRPPGKIERTASGNSSFNIDEFFGGTNGSSSPVVINTGHEILWIRSEVSWFRQAANCR